MSSHDETDDPQALLDLGWHERYCNDRHDLTDGYIRRSIALARQRGDRRMTARALLALANNLRWYRPPDDLRVDPAFEHLPELLESLELLGEDSPEGAALRENALEPLDYPATSEVSHAMSLFRGLGDEAGVADCLAFMQRFEEALELSRRILHRPCMIRCLSVIASFKALGAGGKNDHSERDEALQLARELGDKHRLADALQTVANSCFEGEEQRRAYLEAIELFRQLGYRAATAQTLSISKYAWDDEPDVKSRMLEEELELWRELGTRFSLQAICCEQLAELAALRGESKKAAEYTRRSVALKELGEPTWHLTCAAALRRSAEPLIGAEFYTSGNDRRAAPTWTPRPSWHAPASWDPLFGGPSPTSSESSFPSCANNWGKAARCV